MCPISIPGATGDGNGDLQFDAADILLLTRILLDTHIPTLAEQPQLNTAPLVNGVLAPDCELNVSDLLINTRKLMGHINF